MIRGLLKIRGAISEQLLKWRWTIIWWIEKKRQATRKRDYLKAMEELKESSKAGKHYWRIILNKKNSTGIDKGFSTVKRLNQWTKKQWRRHLPKTASTWSTWSLHDNRLFKITPRNFDFEVEAKLWIEEISAVSTSALKEKVIKMHFYTFIYTLVYLSDYLPELFRITIRVSDMALAKVNRLKTRRVIVEKK